MTLLIAGAVLAPTDVTSISLCILVIAFIKRDGFSKALKRLQFDLKAHVRFREDPGEEEKE